MTAHYKFGARTGGSNIMIGALFLTMGLLFGKSAMAVMSVIPLSIYGVLSIYLGVEQPSSSPIRSITARASL